MVDAAQATPATPTAAAPRPNSSRRPMGMVSSSRPSGAGMLWRARSGAGDGDVRRPAEREVVVARRGVVRVQVLGDVAVGVDRGRGVGFEGRIERLAPT